MRAAEIKLFLQEPMRMAQVAVVTPTGMPLLASLWFVFEDGRFWFSSHPTSPLVKAAKREDTIAVIVDDFSPPEHIRQVRVRGGGRIETHDRTQVDRIYRRYLGADVTMWPGFFQERVSDTSWTLWSVSPDSGAATNNPEFRPVDLRWNTLGDCPLS